MKDWIIVSIFLLTVLLLGCTEKGVNVGDLKDGKPQKSGRFFEDQPDVTDDYQVHIIYLLASNSEDKKYDVNGIIEQLVLTGNEYLKSKTDGQQFRLDLTKEGKLDVSFIRVDKKKKKINRIYKNYRCRETKN